MANAKTKLLKRLGNRLRKKRTDEIHEIFFPLLDRLDKHNLSNKQRIITSSNVLSLIKLAFIYGHAVDLQPNEAYQDIVSAIETYKEGKKARLFIIIEILEELL